MANTPLKPPIPERADDVLLEDLCRELRHVGVYAHCILGKDGRAQIHILEVTLLYNEIIKRKVDFSLSIAVLSEQTKWRMEDLLEECLVYPKILPYVKAADGVREALRCSRCRKKERPPGAELFWFCNSCMNDVLAALGRKEPCDGVVIFRTYTPICRCKHADADTALASEYYAEQITGVCEICIREEVEKRKTRPYSEMIQ